MVNVYMVDGEKDDLYEWMSGYRVDGQVVDRGMDGWVNRWTDTKVDG